MKKTTSKPTTDSKTNQPSTKPSTEQPANKSLANQPSTKPSTEQPTNKPSTDQPSDKPENSSSVKESKDADHYKPIAGEPDVGVAVGDPLPWSWLISNENELPSGTKLKFDKEPDLNKVGTYHIKVIAQYPDGSENSSDTIQVRVRPKTDAEIYEPKVKDLELFEGEYRDDSEYITNKEELPKGTTFTHFLSETFVNYERAGVYNQTIEVRYPDGSMDITRPVTVKINSIADAVSVKAFDELKSPTERYIMLKITNRSGKTLDIGMAAEPKDSHGNDLGLITDDNRGPIAPNQSVILWGKFRDQRPYYFDHIDYHLNLTESVKKSANSDLKVEVTKNDDYGYDVKATNIGSKKIYYPNVHVFLLKNGKVIDENEVLMEPDDADGLQPGESITKSFQSDDYDDVELSYTSSYDK
ncbi:Rib/alpha-like domain-containing protein [uncultured Lactobacillus sp.]|uniref:Rib/alpha-like domain-containing protein n=1 Tax=uncultured Lactobacillus sp. TaxID=153152 RepID=UPI002614D635|nr:Rib/alpha-like domain-containing protein [uncultured Lactobacillus sp.]